MDCIFCKIAKGETGELLYEDELFVAFEDIHPKAKVHVLVIPKKHVESLDALSKDDKSWLCDYLLTIKKIANQLKLKNGYKVIINNGPDGGQVVHHLHAHILGGKKIDSLV